LSYSPGPPGSDRILADRPCPHQSSPVATVGGTARRGGLGSCENTACKTRRVRMPPGAAYFKAGMAPRWASHPCHAWARRPRHRQRDMGKMPTSPTTGHGRDAHATRGRDLPAGGRRPCHARARCPCRF